MNSATLYQRAAFDQHSLDALKTAVKNNTPGGIKAAATQMEGLFVQMMLKSMRDASFNSGLFDTTQSEMFTSMYDQQIAQNIAETGKMGFADLMVSQMGGHPLPTGGAIAAPYPSPAAFPPPVLRGEPQHAGQQGSSPASGVEPGGDPQKNDRFVSRLLAPAMAVARSSGLSHQLIIAQAALESGWGHREILTQDGKPSHNLFGVKATPEWRGETTDVTTTEYTDGQPQKIKGTFKVYPSYSAALSDYATLLINNPRYRNILQSTTPEMAAKALQSAGYATDPAYANKLISVMQQVKNMLKHAVNAYTTDLSSLF